MCTSRLSSVLLASVALVSGTAFLTPALSQTQAQTQHQTQTIKPEVSYERTDLDINQVLVKLMAAGYNKVDKIERERNAYEVRAIDKNGERIRLYVDPQTGDLIKSGRKDAKREPRAGEGAPA